MKLYPNVIIIFFIWAFSILMISYLGFSQLPDSGSVSNNFIERFSNWDGGHYLEIAQYGYSEKFQYAFFPLYPLTIKVVNNFIGNYTFSAILISVISALIAMHFLYQLLSADFSKKLAQQSVFYLLFFPTSFYFLTAYSEGLFFLFVISAFLFLRKRKLFIATIFASLASATRPMGLAVVIALLLEIYLTVGITRKNWYVVLSPLGFIFYSFYLFQNTSDPFYFITAEKNWLRSLSIPGLGFWETIRNIVTPGFIDKNFNALLDLVFAIFGLGMIIRSFRFLPVSYSVYGLISIALPLFTSSLSSMPRFLLPIFPIFILMALVENKLAIFTYQLASLLLLSAFSILFINGYWVS